jgi:single-strand DNA-binding protein
MASVNKVLLVGNLGKDPEVRFTPTGRAVRTFSLATSEQWKTDTGQQERTEWHNIVVWGKSAENCGQYLKKGRQVYVEGEIRSRRYDAKDGTTRSIIEIVVQRVQFLGVKPAHPESTAPSETDGFSGGEGADFPDTPGVTGDDIPF